MDIKTFNSLAPNIPDDIAILLRGPTGVGKSHVVAAIAKKLGLPLIDVRGSTMDEAKVTGIADYVGAKELGVSSFILPSWFVRGVREPVVLFLDELNRSMPQVQQAFFQIVLDRSLGNDLDGNPMTLHPGTRVFAAVNHGSEYDVNDMDPALLRRFAVVDLEACVEDWLVWAEDNNVDKLTREFIRQNTAHWRVEPGTVEPGTVIPTPASWDRLDRSLRHLGLAPRKHAGTRPDGFYALAQCFVGVEASIAFVEFVAKYEKQISAEDVLEGRVTAKIAKSLKASDSLVVLDKLIDDAKEGEWSDKQASNLATFLRTLSGEQMVHFWNKVAQTKNMGKILPLHGQINDEVIELIKASMAVAKAK